MWECLTCALGGIASTSVVIPVWTVTGVTTNYISTQAWESAHWFLTLVFIC